MAKTQKMKEKAVVAVVYREKIPFLKDKSFRSFETLEMIYLDRVSAWPVN